MEQQKLNPTFVYVLAILGLLCCCVGGLGFILAGIAIILANNKLKTAKTNPEDYDPASVKAMNTAKIVAVVILAINIIYFLMTLYSIYNTGWDVIMERSQNIMEQWQIQGT